MIRFVLPLLTDLPVGWSWLIAPADPPRLRSRLGTALHGAVRDAYRLLAERGSLAGELGFVEPEFVDAYARG
jgi:hypothetical protein